MAGARLVLASGSPRRLALLSQINVSPADVIPADIVETPSPNELPRDYALRMATEKTNFVAQKTPDAFVLGADTVVACGRRILPKAEDQDTARLCLALLSGRSHRVYSAIALAAPHCALRKKIVETRVKVRRLEPRAIDEYLASNEWDGKAGGYAIQGLFAKHIVQLIGSYSNVVGLPLYETGNLLTGANWRG